MSGYYVPDFSINAWRNCPNQSIHPGLALYRFFEKDEKNKALKKKENLVLDQEGLRVAVKRQKEQLRSLESKGYKVLRWAQSSATRLVCGLGIPSLAENGMLLDRVWGFPYIPGSALKGIAQDQALMELTDFTDGDKRRETKRLNKDFVACFGAQAAEPGNTLDSYWQPLQGHVIFLDAFIDSNTKKPFDVDIVNPHYGDYYSTGGSVAPADYLSPVPNLFVVLKENIKFHFALAAKPVDLRIKDEKGNFLQVRCNPQALCDLAAQWLQIALQNIGIGGKTQVGYGYFKDDVSFLGL